MEQIRTRRRRPLRRRRRNALFPQTNVRIENAREINNKQEERKERVKFSLLSLCARACVKTARLCVCVCIRTLERFCLSYNVEKFVVCCCCFSFSDFRARAREKVFEGVA
jgi:hypothetical protein